MSKAETTDSHDFLRIKESMLFENATDSEEEIAIENRCESASNP